jgi:hypothetical protein
LIGSFQSLLIPLAPSNGNKIDRWRAIRAWKPRRTAQAVSAGRDHRQAHVDLLPARGHGLVEGDDARLVQVFANLLNNAAKYTGPGGHFAVAVQRVENRGVVEVRDDGVGIPAELLPEMFELFVQGHQGVARSAGGLGIGLALVRSLVDLLGGSVEARSPGLGMGSTFVVRLPGLAAQPAQPGLQEAQSRAAHAPSGRRVVVVDDNKDALDLVSDSLKTLGNDVKTAADGLAALQLVKDFKPAVAILDIGLPVMDGYELADRCGRRWAMRRPSSLP